MPLEHLRFQRSVGLVSHAALALLLACAARRTPVEKAPEPAHAPSPAPLATAGPVMAEPKVDTPVDAGATAATDAGGVASEPSSAAPARPAALPPTAEFVRIGERKLRCKHPRATKPTSRGEPGCRLATRAFGIFHGREAELEYGHNHGMKTGRRDADMDLTDDASDCDVIRALCAVSGELVLFGAGGGIVLFPWVQTTADLDTAIDKLKAQHGVRSVTYSYAMSAQSNAGRDHPQ